MVYDLPEDRSHSAFPRRKANRITGAVARHSASCGHADCNGVVAIIQPRGIFILVSLAMFMMTLITSTVQYFRENQRKNGRKTGACVQAVFRKQTERASDAVGKQLHVLTHHFPRLKNEIFNF